MAELTEALVGLPYSMVHALCSPWTGRCTAQIVVGRRWKRPWGGLGRLGRRGLEAKSGDLGSVQEQPPATARVM